MSLKSMCRSSLYMQRQTISQDQSAGSLRTWTNVGAKSLRGDIQPASATVQLRFQQMELVCTHTIYFVTDPLPSADCRFITTDGKRTFLFRGRQPPASGWQQWPCVVNVEEIL